MEASVVDLRYKMKEVLAALNRRESVTVLHRGKIKGVIQPVANRSGRVQAHPFFGSEPSADSVEAVMKQLRKPRHVV
jgi:hypothetical protein